MRTVKPQTIKVVWDITINDVQEYQSATIESVYWQLVEFNQLGNKDDPKYLQLADATQIEFNAYAFHCCYDMGKISEETLLQTLNLHAAKKTSIGKPC